MQHEMTAHDFEQAVFDILKDLEDYRAAHAERFRFTDIFDAEGHQYVNLVQEGGGVLGIALVGFTYVLEKMGIRFLSLGGTSAGSINTLLLADAGRPAEEKSVRVLDHIAAKDFMDFVDGGTDARMLTQGIQTGSKALIYPSLLVNYGELSDGFGINPGDHFEAWLSSLLQHDTWEKLRANLHDLPEEMYHLSTYSKRKRPVTAAELAPRLAIVAADITTQTKADLPRMAELYYQDPEQVNPASFVRASMSIPFFFTPHRASLAWVQGREEEVRCRWRELAGFSGILPQEILFVDGGIMSNFPIDLFLHSDVIPKRPTIGVKLGVDRNRARTINNLGAFLGSMTEGVRNLRDFEFIRSNPEYRSLVEYIDIEGFDWMDFSISNADKIRLFRKGAEAASAFLRRFNWPEYKDHVKASLLHRIKPLMWELTDLKNLDEVLEVLGIRDNQSVTDKLAVLRKRESPYNILWIDDAFTYALPLAILDRLHTACHTVQSSDAALKYLLRCNRDSDDPERCVDLIISDITRREAGADDRMIGLDFSALLANHPALREIPLLFYAHSREELVDRYGKSLPPNVINRDGYNSIIHRHFIEEVVDALYAKRLFGFSEPPKGSLAG